MPAYQHASINPFSPLPDRFALIQNQVIRDEAGPSDHRPFVLRFAVPRDLGDPAEVLREYQYDADLQIAVRVDDPETPIIAMGRWERTTIGTKDGRGPGQEDWKMDDKG